MTKSLVTKLLPVLLLAATSQATVQVIYSSSATTKLLSVLALLISTTSLTFIAVLLAIGVRKPLFRT